VFFHKSVKKFELLKLIDELTALVFKFLKDYKSSSFPEEIIGPEPDDSMLSSHREPIYNFLPGSVSNKGSGAGGRPFKIGDVNIGSPLISAPLAGISDNTYRIFARFFGSALCYSEMITSHGICSGHKKSLSLADITNHERPCAVQIFGSDPDIMVEAAKQIENKADIIDVNMGCPVAKVLKSKSGGYLIRDKNKVRQIITRLSSALHKPLTVKTRTGWDSSSINILEIAKIAQDCGAGAISIHGRTVKQGFSGKVDYELIKKVREKVKIPVIASGDIDSPGKARKILDYTGCEGIMIGRAVKGRLWIFTNILLFLLGNVKSPGYPEFDPSISWKKEFSRLYLKFLIYFKGEERAVKEFRKHLCWIFKGTRGISRVRCELSKIESFKDTENFIGNI